MRRTAILISVVLSAAGMPASAHGASDHGAGHAPAGDPTATPGAHAVTIANRAFSPGRVTALVGDSVAWRNADLMLHNVTASAAGVASGPLNRGERFTHSFAAAGSYPYVCTLHPFMKGQVDVHPALLEVASDSVVAGRDLAIHGRALADGLVTIEQRAAGEADFTPVASLRADAAGGFHGMVRPQATTTYRAVGERGASPGVTVTVASELRIAVTARRSNGFTKVRVEAPGASDATAILQIYSRERFTWVDRRRSRISGDGRATFKLRSGLRYHARVVVSTPGGLVLGTSRSVKLPR